MGATFSIVRSTSLLTSLRSASKKGATERATALRYDWRIAEFAVLPLFDLDLMADPMNRIEKKALGRRVAVARAVFLHKADPSEAGPSDLGPLLILLTIADGQACGGLRIVKAG